MLTIIIPLCNEADSLVELHGQIARVCDERWARRLSVADAGSALLAAWLVCAGPVAGTRA